MKSVEEGRATFDFVNQGWKDKDHPGTEGYAPIDRLKPVGDRSWLKCSASKDLFNWLRDLEHIHLFQQTLKGLHSRNGRPILDVIMDSKNIASAAFSKLLNKENIPASNPSSAPNEIQPLDKSTPRSAEISDKKPVSRVSIKKEPVSPMTPKRMRKSAVTIKKEPVPSVTIKKEPVRSVTIKEPVDDDQSFESFTDSTELDDESFVEVSGTQGGKLGGKSDKMEVSDSKDAPMEYDVPITLLASDENGDDIAAVKLAILTEDLDKSGLKTERGWLSADVRPFHQLF